MAGYTFVVGAETCDYAATGQRSPAQLAGSGNSLADCVAACNAQDFADCQFIRFTQNGFCKQFATCTDTVTTCGSDYCWKCRARLPSAASPPPATPRASR